MINITASTTRGIGAGVTERAWRIGQRAQGFMIFHSLMLYALVYFMKHGRKEV